MASRANRSHSLISYYELQYKDRHGVRDLDLNRHKHRWGFEAMIDDLGESEARAVIDFYLAVGGRHSVDKLLFNYEKMYQRMMEIRKDEKERAEQMKETARRVEEWRKNRGDS